MGSIKPAANKIWNKYLGGGADSDDKCSLAHSHPHLKLCIAAECMLSRWFGRQSHRFKKKKKKAKKYKWFSPQPAKDRPGHWNNINYNHRIPCSLKNEW